MTPFGRNTKIGFGIAAGIDAGVANEIGALCQELGYASLWSNDHPAASGLKTVADLGESAPALELGVGALALDRHTPAEIAAQIAEQGIEPARLWVAIGAGFSKRPLGVVRDGVAEMRAALPEGVRLAVAAMGPKMCALAGELADGVFLNWMTPERSAWAREHVAEGAQAVARDLPEILGYVRVAVGKHATSRLTKEETFYRELHEGYRRHFAELGADLGTVGIPAADAAQVARQLGPYKESMDHIVVRALASATIESMTEVAEAAAVAI